MSTVDTRNMTRRPAPRFPFGLAATKALPGWEISLVFVEEAKATSLNKTLRKKSYAPNVLSYQTGTKSGEIVICLSVAKKQAPSYGMSYATYVGYLFIHGMMHLKGYAHGSTMERREQALLARLITIPRNGKTTHRNRNRYRNSSDESRRR